MNRRFLRITLIGLVALVAIASAWTWLSASFGVQVNDSAKQNEKVAAATLTPGKCTTKGVTVMVAVHADDKEATVTRCVVGDELNGWQLLQAAQLAPQGTDENPVGFLCRLMGVPASDAQDCVDTPTAAEGSWSYFYSSFDAKAKKATWQYSPVGSATRVPKCGDVEAWVFTDKATYEPGFVPKFNPEPLSCDN